MELVRHKARALMAGRSLSSSSWLCLSQVFELRGVQDMGVCWVFIPAASWAAFHVPRELPPREKRGEHPWHVTGNAGSWGVFYMRWAKDLVALESILEEGECQRCLSEFKRAVGASVAGGSVASSLHLLSSPGASVGSGSSSWILPTCGGNFAAETGAAPGQEKTHWAIHRGDYNTTQGIFGVQCPAGLRGKGLWQWFSKRGKEMGSVWNRAVTEVVSSRDLLF